MILVKEEFVGGEKWRRAVKLGGSDAIALWLAMKCYCSQHTETEGFVPEEDLDGLPGVPQRARRALRALLDCGRVLPAGERGPGLVEPVEGGWRMHDYLDHSPAPEETELRRAKARLRKQLYRDVQRRELEAVKRQTGALGAGAAPRDNAGHVPREERDNAGHVPRDGAGHVPRDSLPGARPREAAREHAPARGSAPPSPALPSPPHPSKKSLELIKHDPERGRARGPAPLGEMLACRPPEPRAPAVVASLEPSAEHRRFATEHGLDLDRIAAELRSEPGWSQVTPAQAGICLAGRLMSAATEAERTGAA